MVTRFARIVWPPVCLRAQELCRSLALRVVSRLIEVILAPEPADEIASYLWENTARSNAALALVKMCSDPQSTRPTLPVRHAVLPRSAATQYAVQRAVQYGRMMPRGDDALLACLQHSVFFAAASACVCLAGWAHVRVHCAAAYCYRCRTLAACAGRTVSYTAWCVMRNKGWMISWPQQWTAARGIILVAPSMRCAAAWRRCCGRRRGLGTTRRCTNRIEEESPAPLRLLVWVAAHLRNAPAAWCEWAELIGD
jgi:hypothetical protein